MELDEFGDIVPMHLRKNNADTKKRKTSASYREDQQNYRSWFGRVVALALMSEFIQFLDPMSSKWTDQR